MPSKVYKEKRAFYLLELLHYQCDLAWIYSNCEHLLSVLYVWHSRSTSRWKVHSKIKHSLLLLYILIVLSAHYLVTFPKWTQNISKPCSETQLQACTPSVSTCNAVMTPFTCTIETAIAMDWHTLYANRSKEKTENVFSSLLILSKQNNKQPSATDGLPSGKF